MAEEQRDGALDGRFLVDEMDVEGAEAVDVDGGSVVWKLVDGCFGFPPVVLLLPVFCQAFDIGQWGSVRPTSFIKFVREVRVFELLGKLFQLTIGYGNVEGFNGCHGCSNAQAKQSMVDTVSCGREK